MTRQSAQEVIDMDNAIIEMVINSPGIARVEVIAAFDIGKNRIERAQRRLVGLGRLFLQTSENNELKYFESGYAADKKIAGSLEPKKARKTSKEDKQEKSLADLTCEAFIARSVFIDSLWKPSAQH